MDCFSAPVNVTLWKEATAHPSPFGARPRRLLPGAATAFVPQRRCLMAAEPQPKALTRKPLLLNKVEGSQEVVNMAAIAPKEDGVISVSEDR